MAPTPIIIGQRFNMLTITADISSGKKLRSVLAKCDCRIEKEFIYSNVRRGNSKSCGTCEFRPKKHARSASKEYKAWQNMHQRCGNPNHKYYKNYGGRGIVICEAWREFSNFFADMGICPDGMTLDRIDNSGGYEPGNCRWVDMATQTNNRRNNRMIEFNGESKSVTQWASDYKISVSTLQSRLNRGLDIESALAAPLAHPFHGNGN